jgi:hypothetical protein
MPSNIKRSSCPFEKHEFPDTKKISSNPIFLAHPENEYLIFQEGHKRGQVGDCQFEIFLDLYLCSTYRLV